jgi:uncharacterized protein with PQ loop repeat
MSQFSTALGFIAAAFTNISLYPQAYKLHVIINSNDIEKIKSISLTTFLLNLTGSFLWLWYGIILKLYPIIFGSIFSIVPSLYITIVLILYKMNNQDNNQHKNQNNELEEK